MTNELVELGKEVAYAQAGHLYFSNKLEQSSIEKSASEAMLRSAMLKAGVARFDLDEYREVVWEDETDKIMIIQKG